MTYYYRVFKDEQLKQEFESPSIINLAEALKLAELWYGDNAYVKEVEGQEGKFIFQPASLARGVGRIDYRKHPWRSAEQ